MCIESNKPLLGFRLSNCQCICRIKCFWIWIWIIITTMIIIMIMMITKTTTTVTTTTTSIIIVHGLNWFAQIHNDKSKSGYFHYGQQCDIYSSVDKTMYYIPYIQKLSAVQIFSKIQTHWPIFGRLRFQMQSPENESYVVMKVHWRLITRNQLPISRHHCNSMVSNWRQTITWTNGDSVHWRTCDAHVRNRSQWSTLFLAKQHNSDVIMGQIACQITSLTIVYSTVYSGVEQRKHQSSASLAFVRGIHRRPVNSPQKWPVTREIFPFDDVIMFLAKQTTMSFSQMNGILLLVSYN